MKGQEVIHCPQCGGNKVKNVGPSGVFLTIAVISTILIVTIPIAIACFSVWLVKKKKDKYHFVCGECKRGFDISDGTLNEYNSYVKSNEKTL